jgi:zinc-ribbon family
VLVIFGFRAYIRSLAIVTLVCTRCGNPAAHRVIERVRKFTLFFVPLFPVSKTRSVTCTYCGQFSAISAEQADQYVAAAPRSQAPAVESIPQLPRP